MLADHTRRQNLRRPVDRLKLIHKNTLAIRRVIHSRAYWGLGSAPRTAMDNVGNRIRCLIAEFIQIISSNDC